MAAWERDTVVAPAAAGGWQADAIVDPVEPEVRKRGYGEELGRQGGLTARLAANVLTSPLQIGGDALNKGINALTGAKLQMPSEIINRQLDRFLPTPENAVERAGQAMAQSAPAFALPAALPAQMAGNAFINASLAKPGEEASQGALGAAGGALPKAVSSIGGWAAKNAFGGLTGAGGEAVEQAYKAGQRGGTEFLPNMRGTAEAGDVVAQAREGLETMRQQMYSRYSAGKNGRGGWAGDTTPLDFRPIGQAFNDASARFSFQGRPQPGVVEVQERVRNELTNWLEQAQQNPAFLTVEGLDALKRHIATIVPTDVTNRAGRAFVNEVNNNVKAAIIRQRPEYAGAMRDYWRGSEQLDEITRSLSLGDRASIDTALRKLQSLMRNNVNTNYGQRLTSARALAEQGGQDIMPAIAGQALNSWTPRGLQQAAGTMGAMANPVSAFMLPALSPRIVGEGAHLAGRASNIMPNEQQMAALLAAMFRKKTEEQQ